jgi:tubulin polyglutamylase TTLL9
MPDCAVGKPSSIGNVTQLENYIVQKYISEPLLIGGKKFDMRVYALVTCYSPLTIYLYRSGFARFTHVRYDETKISQSDMHLTNVAIQKNSENYDEAIGGKWYLDKLKGYLSSKFGNEKVNLAFYRVQEIIIRTLEALQKAIANDRNNSFELYGFDILFDNKMEAWLL